MHASRTSSALLLISLALHLPSTSFAAEGETVMFAIEPSVAEVVATLDSIDPVRPVSKVMDKTILSPASLTVSRETSYEHIAGNLWGTQTLATSGGGPIKVTALSLCGLVELLASSESMTSADKTIPVLVGKLFLPIGMHISTKHTSTTKVSTLKLLDRGQSLCNPKASQTFSYQTSVETETSHGKLSNKYINDTTWSCTVGEPAPLSSVTSALDGHFLPVACQGQNASANVKTTTTLAFIPETGVYLKLATDSPTFKSKTDITSLILK